jgi:hypothetical protein
MNVRRPSPARRRVKARERRRRKARREKLTLALLIESRRLSLLGRRASSRTIPES